MVEGKLKSRSKRRIKVKSTKGTKIHYRRSSVNQAKCALCSKKLHGLKRLTSDRQKKSSKSSKTVNRKYGGNLCSACSRAKIKQQHV